jgi:hypothetical protein
MSHKPNSDLRSIKISFGVGWYLRIAPLARNPSHFICARSRPWLRPPSLIAHSPLALLSVIDPPYRIQIGMGGIQSDRRIVSARWGSRTHIPRVRSRAALARLLPVSAFASVCGFAPRVSFCGAPSISTSMHRLEAISRHFRTVY